MSNTTSQLPTRPHQPPVQQHWTSAEQTRTYHLYYIALYCSPRTSLLLFLPHSFVFIITGYAIVSIERCLYTSAGCLPTQRLREPAVPNAGRKRRFARINMVMLSAARWPRVPRREAGCGCVSHQDPVLCFATSCVLPDGANKLNGLLVQHLPDALWRQEPRGGGRKGQEREREWERQNVSLHNVNT